MCDNGLMNFDLWLPAFSCSVILLRLLRVVCFSSMMLKTWASVQFRSLSTSSGRSAIQRVTVIGSGIMGSGIAQVCHGLFAACAVVKWATVT